jgi:hypothetical protein
MLVEPYRLNLVLKVLAEQDGQDEHAPGNPEETFWTLPPLEAQVPIFAKCVLCML